MFKRTIYTILFFVYCFFMLWLAAKPAHAQSAFKSVHLFETPTTQATAGGTTTLLLASQTVQRFTGTQNQTVVLPNATTLTVGMYFLIANDSTGVLTVNDASSGLIATVLASNSVSLRLITNGSAAGVWTVENNYTAVPASGISGIVPLANGGTALSNVASQGGIAYGTSSGISLTAAQTSGQAIISQGTGAPIGFNPTSGAVLFAGTSGAMSQSANTFSWDQNNTRLTVGGGSNTVTVGGAAKNSVLSLSGTRASNEYELGIHKHSATLNPGMYLLRSRGSESAPTIVQNGDLLGVMDGLGFDGTDFEIGAQIDYVVDGTPGSNDMPGAIVFKTTPDGGFTPATAATISNDKTLTLYGALDTALDVSGVVLTSTAGVISSRSQLQLVNGGTNNNIVVSQGGAAYGTSSGISLNAAGSAGQYLRSNGTSAPTWSAVSVSGEITGILPLANGGTNNANVAVNGGAAYGTATGISLTAVGVSGTVLTSTGAGIPLWYKPATVIGTCKWTGAGSCQYTTGNTGGVYTDFGADTDCNNPAVTGSASAPGTKIPYCTFSSLPEGQYVVMFNGLLGPETSSVSASQQYRISDGSTTSGQCQSAANSTSATTYECDSLNGYFSYTTAQSNISFRPVGASSSDSNDPQLVVNNATTRQMEIIVIYYPR